MDVGEKNPFICYQVPFFFSRNFATVLGKPELRAYISQKIGIKQVITWMDTNYHILMGNSIQSKGQGQPFWESGL